MKAVEVMIEQFGKALAPKKGWRAKAPSKREALRALLSDGKEHHQYELAEVASYRYGARLHELHKQKDAVHYERRHDAEDDSLVFYRQVDKSKCTLCKAKKGETES